MRLHNQSYEVTTSGIDESSQFKVNLSAKSFQILFEGIYTDREKAVVRELICNAADAHVWADNLATPIDIHLPNKMEPYFEVKDYGTGLSHDDVMSLYTTLFQSTKDTRNDMIGALGLGSKTPFAVGDTFTVLSRVDGVERSYTAYLDHDKIPAITFIGADETDEHNGLTVQIPIGISKFDLFAEKLQDVLFFFSKDFTFNISGRMFERTHYTETEALIKVEQTSYVPDAKSGYHYHRSYPHYAIMGNIAYPVDINQLDDSAQQFLGSIRSTSYTDFEIGDLDIQASREALGYDEVTKQKLNEVYGRLITSSLVELNKNIEAAETFQDAFVVVKDAESRMWKEYTKSLNLYWQGVPISLKSKFDIPTWTVETAVEALDGQTKIVKSKYNYFGLDLFTRTRGYGNAPFSRSSVTNMLNFVPEEFSVVFKDVSTAYTLRLQRAVDEGVLKKNVIIVNPNPKAVPSVAFSMFDMFDTRHRPVMMSDLPRPEKKKPEGVADAMSKGKYYEDCAILQGANWYTRPKKTMVNGLLSKLYYVEIKRNTPIEHDTDYLIKSSSFAGVRILGVRGSKGLKLARTLGLRHYNEVLEDFVFNDNELAKHAISQAWGYANVKDCYIDHLDELPNADWAVRIVKQFEDYKDHRQHNNIRWKKIEAFSKEYSEWFDIAYRMLNSAVDALDNLFPMLNAYSWKAEESGLLKKHRSLYLKALREDAEANS